jgi:hypothetical protein
MSKELLICNLGPNDAKEVQKTPIRDQRSASKATSFSVIRGAPAGGSRGCGNLGQVLLKRQTL